MYTYEIKPEYNLIVLSFSGSVHWQDIEQYFGELVQDTNYHGDLMGVCDLRGSDLQFTPEESRKLARMSREQQLTRGNWAFITDTPSGTVLAMTFAKEIGDFHASKFFTTVAAASSYLGVDLTKFLPPDK